MGKKKYKEVVGRGVEKKKCNVLVVSLDLTSSQTELYEYCLKEGYADGNLIAKWKKVRCMFVSVCACHDVCCTV